FSIEIDRDLGRVFQAEHAGIVVISERFGVTAPRGHGAQRVLGVVRAHVVFQLVQKPAFRRRVIGALLQYAADMGRQWNVGQELLLEQLLAVVGAEFGELLSGIGKLYVAALD